MNGGIDILVEYEEGESDHGLVLPPFVLGSLPFPRRHPDSSLAPQHAPLAARAGLHQVLSAEVGVQLLAFAPRVGSPVLCGDVPVSVAVSQAIGGAVNRPAFSAGGLQDFLPGCLAGERELTRAGYRNLAAALYRDGEQVLGAHHRAGSASPEGALPGHDVGQLHQVLSRRAYDDSLKALVLQLLFLDKSLFLGACLAFQLIGGPYLHAGIMNDDELRLPCLAFYHQEVVARSLQSAAPVSARPRLTPDSREWRLETDGNGSRAGNCRAVERARGKHHLVLGTQRVDARRDFVVEQSGRISDAAQEAPQYFGVNLLDGDLLFGQVYSQHFARIPGHSNLASNIHFQSSSRPGQCSIAVDLRQSAAPAMPCLAVAVR